MMLTVLITGATSGIGEEFAHYYGNRGDTIHLLGRNNEKLLELKAQYESVAEVFLWNVDLSKEDQLNHFLNQVRHTTFDVVINNAGFGDLDEFIKSDLNHIEAMLATNITALTKIAHVVLNTMANQRRGYLLNVASLAGYFSGPYMATYYATKNYVLALSQALTIEMQPYNVTVSALCPGPTPTKFGLNASFPKMGSLKTLARTSVKEVVDSALVNMAKGKAIIVPGLVNNFAVLLSKITPRMLSTKVTGMYQKQAMVKREIKEEEIYGN